METRSTAQEGEARPFTEGLKHRHSRHSRPSMRMCRANHHPLCPGNVPIPLSRPASGPFQSFTASSTAVALGGWAFGILESAVVARKPDGAWRICCDGRGLNTIGPPRVYRRRSRSRPSMRCRFSVEQMACVRVSSSSSSVRPAAP